MGAKVMTVEGVNNFNKLTSKRLEKEPSRKSTARESEKVPADSKSTPEKGKGVSREEKHLLPPDQVQISGPENQDPQRIASREGVDSFERTGQEKVDGENLNEAFKPDKVELSWPDSELANRISEMIERIKEQKEHFSKRIEAARVLIMRKAYDDNEALRKTAEAILRGEDVEEISL
jgi:hypothetical protein